MESPKGREEQPTGSALNSQNSKACRSNEIAPRPGLCGRDEPSFSSDIKTSPTQGHNEGKAAVINIVLPRHSTPSFSSRFSCCDVCRPGK
ncbi:hypothetical protein Q7C36_020084 [Tachysurus vachellii]|uniref:Uncharacterized protein n=1 Tax=Tachysurus vachellii TaxID=175792 RepID=A0AA88LSZ6_TACVA|nr:hypothetical protein Q7C36_020084 [Tachysurus vachellii]